MYRPGELDKLITIQRGTETDDGMGGKTIAWNAVVSDLWAHVRPRTANEQERFDKLNATAVYLFVIRYRSDLLESDRIVWDGVEYNIRSILTKGGRSMYLEIEAERGVAQ
jgi:SPP1 family predicted phage head-tail adaptor